MSRNLRLVEPADPVESGFKVFFEQLDALQAELITAAEAFDKSLQGVEIPDIVDQVNHTLEVLDHIKSSVLLASLHNNVLTWVEPPKP